MWLSLFLDIPTGLHPRKTKMRMDNHNFQQEKHLQMVAFPSSCQSSLGYLKIGVQKLHCFLGRKILYKSLHGGICVNNCSIPRIIHKHSCGIGSSGYIAVILMLPMCEYEWDAYMGHLLLQTANPNQSTLTPPLTKLVEAVWVLSWFSGICCKYHRRVSTNGHLLVCLSGMKSEDLPAKLA